MRLRSEFRGCGEIGRDFHPPQPLRQRNFARVCLASAAAHFLEAWGDSRAWDGTASICQPLIEPLYDGKTSDQLLAFLASEPETESDAIVRKTFADMDDESWRQSLNDGLIKGTAFKTVTATIQPQTVQPAPRAEGLRNSIPSGFKALRWPVRHQRLVAGVARSADENRLGQRGLDLEEGCGHARRRDRGHGEDHGGRAIAGDRGVRSSRPTGGRDWLGARVWPDDGASISVPMLASTPISFARSGGMFLCRCAGDQDRELLRIGDDAGPSPDRRHRHRRRAKTGGRKNTTAPQ